MCECLVSIQVYSRFVFIGSMVVNVCNLYMHKRIFYVLAVWVDGLDSFAQLFLPHVGSLSHSRVQSSLFSLSCDGFKARTRALDVQRTTYDT